MVCVDRESVQEDANRKLEEYCRGYVKDFADPPEEERSLRLHGGELIQMPAYAVQDTSDLATAVDGKCKLRGVKSRPSRCLQHLPWHML